MRFTTDEFKTMVNELLYNETISYETLCQIAVKTLKPSVTRWCREDDCLRGRGYEEDIMQEILLRLIKTTITYFLHKKGTEGPYNDDPEGFEDWMFTVAMNLKRDFANDIRKYNFSTEDIDDNDTVAAPICEDPFEAEERIERLKEAMWVVLSSDAGIYKVLTWLAQFVIVINEDSSRIEANNLILLAFEFKTLYEMYEMVLYASNKIPWLVINEEQKARIKQALSKKRDGDITYGDTRYRDCFMKVKGEASGKKSISDWVNRMNSMVVRVLKTEPNDSD